MAHPGLVLCTFPLDLTSRSGFTNDYFIWQNAKIFIQTLSHDGMKHRLLFHFVLHWDTCVLVQSTYILTYSMVQSPSWEANWFAASQEIPHISQNPKVHYCTHKRPPPVSILGQTNPVHLSTSHLLEIHPNIIHPSTPRSPQWFGSRYCS